MGLPGPKHLRGQGSRSGDDCRVLSALLGLFGTPSWHPQRPSQTAVNWGVLFVGILVKDPYYYWSVLGPLIFWKLPNQDCPVWRPSESVPKTLRPHHPGSLCPKAFMPWVLVFDSQGLSKTRRTGQGRLREAALGIPDTWDLSTSLLEQSKRTRLSQEAQDPNKPWSC